MTTTTAAVRRARSTLLALLVLIGAVALGAPAQAHDVLVSSEPAEGEVLEESPQAVVLSFNNAPLEVGSSISVVDAAGDPVAEGTGTLEGSDVVLALDTALPAGELEVRWRVASSDGHPIEGVIPFTLDVPAEPATTEPATTEPAEEPAAEETTEPAQTTEPAETAAPAETTEPAETGASGLPTAARIAIAAAALASVVGLVVLIVRRGRTDRL